MSKRSAICARRLLVARVWRVAGARAARGADGRRSRRSSRRDGVTRGTHASASRCRSRCPRASTSSRTSRAIPMLDPDRADDRRRLPASRSTEIVFPAPIDLKQAGVDQPLAVFEREFAIGVQLDVARRRRAAATSWSRRSCATRRATTTLCYPPATADVAVDAARRARAATAGRAAAPRRLRARLRSAAASAPAAAAAAPRSGDRLVRGDRAPRRRRRRRSTTSTSLGTTGGYLGTDEFLDVHPQRRERREGARPVRGPRAARDSAARLPRRPGAEPHAVRPADDSDQPRDHRRRRAGRIARPRLPARRGVRRARWRSSTACSAWSSS